MIAAVSPELSVTNHSLVNVLKVKTINCVSVQIHLPCGFWSHMAETALNPSVSTQESKGWTLTVSPALIYLLVKKN